MVMLVLVLSLWSLCLSFLLCQMTDCGRVSERLAVDSRMLFSAKDPSCPGSLEETPEQPLPAQHRELPFP